MTSPRALLTLAFGLCAAHALRAQENPPPWWFASDNNTVTIGWEFSTPPVAGQPIQPTFQTGPSWYAGSTIPFVNGVQWQSTLTLNQGVLAVTSPQAVTVTADIANDPRPNWIKVMWVQYDIYTDGGRIDESEIAPDLNNYLRRNVRIDESPLGQNWSRVTIDAELQPQPIGEDFLWDFLPGLGLGALDNIYISTRCIPLDNETPESEGLGEPTGVSVDVQQATGNDDARGCAYHQNGAGQEVFWVSATTQSTVPGTPHDLYGFDANSGALVFTLPQSLTNLDSTTGLLDLTTADVGGLGDRVYGAFLNGLGIPELRAFNPFTLTWDPGRTVVVPALTGRSPLGLAFNPDGDTGAGTFWITDQTGDAHEVTLQGQLLRTYTTGFNSVPGMGYDPIRAELYLFSRDGSQNPTPISAVGSIVNVKTLAPTGARFYGDLNVNTFGNGGRALGMDFFRRPGPRFARMVCLADNGQGRDILYELNATFRYGLSCFGDISMNSTEPYLGSTNWAVTASGAPRGAVAFLYAGFSKSISPGGTPLPFALGGLGLPECAVLHSMDLGIGATAVSGTGTAAVTIPLPTSPIFSYQPIYWQWVFIGGAVPGGGLATSPAGKTVLY